MAKADRSTSHPNTVAGDRPTGVADNGSVTVYDNDETTEHTTTANRTATTPATWRATDETVDSNTRRPVGADPAPAARGGISMMTTIIGLIVILVLVYLLWQFFF
jgi:hypothetical protein